MKEIESARPFDQLTVDDVAAASDLEEKVTYMVKNGKWEVQVIEKNSVIWLLCNSVFPHQLN